MTDNKFKCTKLGCAFPYSTLLKEKEVKEKVQDQLITLVGDDALTEVTDPNMSRPDQRFKLFTAVSGWLDGFLRDPIAAMGELFMNTVNLPNAIQDALSSGNYVSVETKYGLSGKRAYFNRDVVESWNKSCDDIGGQPMQKGRSATVTDEFNYGVCPYAPERVGKKAKTIGLETSTRLFSQESEEEEEEEVDYGTIHPTEQGATVADLSGKLVYQFNDDKKECIKGVRAAKDLVEQDKIGGEGGAIDTVKKINKKHNCNIPLPLQGNTLEARANRNAFEDLAFTYNELNYSLED